MIFWNFWWKHWYGFALIFINHHLKKEFLDILPKVFCSWHSILLIREFHSSINSIYLGVFITAINLVSLVSKPVCFQSTSPTWINLVFHISFWKVLFKNSKHFKSQNLRSPQALNYSSQKPVSKKKCKNENVSRLLKIKSFSKDLKEIHTTYNYSYFQSNFLKLLNKHAPIKKN